MITRRIKIMSGSHLIAIFQNTNRYITSNPASKRLRIIINTKYLISINWNFNRNTHKPTTNRSKRMIMLMKVRIRRLGGRCRCKTWWRIRICKTMNSRKNVNRNPRKCIWCYSKTKTSTNERHINLTNMIIH